MDIVELSPDAPADKRGAVVALGTFDGLHLEDQRVVQAARDLAAPEGLVSAVLLFEPHPRRLLAPGAPPFSLMTSDQRRREFERCGVQRLYRGMFSPELAALSPPEFVQLMLKKRLGASHVCVSTNAQFGRSQAERAPILTALAAAFGDRFIGVQPARHTGVEPVTSDAIREALQGGDLARARRMMGRAYAIEGPVIHGAKLGRTIGFPTVNIPLGEFLRPALGIYASLSRLSDGRRLQGVSYIGRRPTVQGVEELLETFLFDINEDLYGQTFETELLDLLRPDRTFDSLEEMKHQIAHDCSDARAAFARRERDHVQRVRDAANPEPSSAVAL